jgi:hypothetical protein
MRLAKEISLKQGETVGDVGCGQRGERGIVLISKLRALDVQNTIYGPSEIGQSNEFVQIQTFNGLNVLVKH